MPRSVRSIRGIVLAVSTLLVATPLLAACNPPMPPDVLAAKAESQITCANGETPVAVPEAFTGSVSAVGSALNSVCPEQLVTEVAAGDPAPVVLLDRTPTADDIAAFAATCPTGSTLTVPAFSYPVTLAYNVPGLEGVVMTPEVVAGILNGTVTTWEDPLIADANPDYDFTGLAPFTLMSVDSPQGSVAAMTAWLAKAAPTAWTKGEVATLEGAQSFPTTADLIGEMLAVESAIAVLPVAQAQLNALAMANLPVTLEDGTEVVITTDDVQAAKIGSGATQLTTDESGNVTASAAVGGLPVPENFDLASSKIVLAEDQPVAGWPVLGYAHLLVCDDPANPLPLAFAQYVARLAGQGSLETAGYVPLPEPIRIRLFTPLKVVVADDGVAPASSAAPSPSA